MNPIVLVGFGGIALFVAWVALEVMLSRRDFARRQQKYASLVTMIKNGEHVRLDEHPWLIDEDRRALEALMLTRGTLHVEREGVMVDYPILGGGFAIHAMIEDMINAAPPTRAAASSKSSR